MKIHSPRKLAAAIAAAATFLTTSAEANENQAGGIEEITVTAVKRSQDLQKTSAAITAIDSEMIEVMGVGDIRAAQNLIPSARFQKQNSATEIYIRGVGSTLDTPNIDPPTSLNFNGVYIPREASAMPFFDMQSIEVLPGPQGTLYGRGSLGGIVNASFVRPNDVNEGYVKTEVGNLDLVRTTLVGNYAPSDGLAFRIGVDYANDDGWQKTGAGSKDDLTIRAAVTFDISDAASVYLWGVHVQREGNSNSGVTVGVDPVTGGFAGPGVFLNDDPYDDTRTPEILALPFNPFLGAPSAPFAQPTDLTTKIIGAEVAVDLDDSTVTYIASYLDSEVDVYYHLGGYPTFKPDEAEQWTQELRIAGDFGAKLSYLAGLYAYDFKKNGQFILNGFPALVVDDNHLKGYAAFAESTWHISDETRLIVGGRVSKDERTGNGNYTGLLGANFEFVSGAPYDFNNDYSNVDYKLAFEFDAAEDVMLYSALQTGFQPGSFNTYPSTPALSNEVKEANLTAYTAGFKSRFFDNTLQVNNEIFYYDYEDLFASAYNGLTNVLQTFNAQKIEIYGNQLDILYQPTDIDRFNFSVGYLHARNDEFVLPDGSANYNGFQLQYAPDWTVNIGYSHEFYLGNSARVLAQINTRYEDSFFSDYSHVPGGEQASYTKTDASLTYYSSDDRWDIGVWIKNIEDEPVLAATGVGSASPLQPLGATTNLELPRTYGVRATFNF